MNDSLSLAPTGDRWGAMCLRLAPVLGDVQGILGPQWYLTVEALFTDADLEVAVALKRWTTDAPDWFVLRFSSRARRLDEQEEGVACAPSLAEAVAMLLRSCEAERVLPTRIAYDPLQRTIRVFAGDDLLVTIEPLLSVVVSERMRKRAKSTICGVRRSAEPRSELLKRARKWPGMAELWLEDAFTDIGRLGMVHHSIPQEWLISAEKLAAACGRSDLGRSTLEMVAAVALGAPSWNHLASPWGDRSAALLQPWLVRRGDGIVGFYADGIDAFADTMARLPREFAVGWPAISFASGHGFALLDYVPVYSFRRMEPQGQEDATSVDGDDSDVWVHPVPRGEAPKQEQLMRARQALAGGVDGLSVLFGVGLPQDVKVRMLDERAGEMLIVQEGPWRITRTGDPRRNDTLLWVYRLDARFNCSWSAAVPTYKGLLLTHRPSGSHVLCADYDGRHPVAVIEGLSPLAVAQVRANLIDSSEDRMEYRMHERDRRVFEKLMAKVSLSQAR